VSFSLGTGEAAAITGPSGSGKSTLLYMLGALEPPTSGTITLEGQNPFQLEAVALASFRNEQIGFVFQDHCLLPQCSVLENVLIPTLVGAAKTHCAGRALSSIAARRLHRYRLAALSGGERQRGNRQSAHQRPPCLRRTDRQSGSFVRGQRRGGAVRSALHLQTILSS
jgi:lipoprotein-releasing system ATP-binding protein